MATVSLPEGLKIRPARASDSSAVTTLVFGILQSFGFTPDPSGTDADLANLEATYPMSGGCFLIVETSAGEIVGCCGLLPLKDNEFELRKMYLASRYRGLGIGAKLLRMIIAEARHRNAKRNILETAFDLKDAMKLYERNGFHPVQREKMAARCDVIMALEL